MNKKPLDILQLQREAAKFAILESIHPEPSLFGVTDGKAVGTYLEHKFQAFLSQAYDCTSGNSARGIDFPDLNVDMKVTSIRQPQSSCPFRSARQKIFGLGYALLIFVYEKTDDPVAKTSRLEILHAIFVEASRTADFQCTRGILQILANNGNRDDLMAFMFDRNLPLDEIEAANLANEILTTPPELGYLTISNALQWRLQYGRVIEEAGKVAGILKVI